MRITIRPVHIYDMGVLYRLTLAQDLPPSCSSRCHLFLFFLRFLCGCGCCQYQTFSTHSRPILEEASRLSGCYRIVNLLLLASKRTPVDDSPFTFTPPYLQCGNPVAPADDSEEAVSVGEGGGAAKRRLGACTSGFWSLAPAGSGYPRLTVSPEKETHTHRVNIVCRRVRNRAKGLVEVGETRFSRFVSGGV